MELAAHDEEGRREEEATLQQEHHDLAVAIAGRKREQEQLQERQAGWLAELGEVPGESLDALPQRYPALQGADARDIADWEATREACEETMRQNRALPH